MTHIAVKDHEINIWIGKIIIFNRVELLIFIPIRHCFSDIRFIGK